ncbi:MAG: hypothetical protein KGH54_01460 [Candidatus Micrarchaeota archaeon]|nr:hypothetical protein [Candidatus Micrarchaeota archaeon]
MQKEKLKEIKNTVSRFFNEMDSRTDAIMNFTDDLVLKKVLRGLDKTNRISLVPAIVTGGIYGATKSPYAELAMIFTGATYLGSLLTEFILVIRERKQTKSALKAVGLTLQEATTKAVDASLLERSPSTYQRLLSKVYLEEIIRDAKKIKVGN